MNESGPDPSEDRLEPTIVPVSRHASEIPGSFDGERQGAWRTPLLVMAAVLAVAGVVAVFAYLPVWVEEAAPSPEPAADTAAVPEPEGPVLSEEEIAALTAQAETLLAELLEQQRSLAVRAVESWGDTTWSAYENAARLADDAFLAEDLTEAVNQYQAALRIGAELLARSENIVAEAMAAANAAIAGNNAELAASQFSLVLEIEPDNAAAARGLARAQSLPGVIDAMRRGDALSEQGELEQAVAAYREAIAIDPEYAAARVALDATNRRIANARFDRLITEGFAAIDDRSFERAAERFNTALGMRPDSDVARDGLAQAEQGLELDAIAMAEVRGLAFERRELWDRAIERYREALATDATLAFAIEGLERSQLRADLDVKLETLLDQPRLLLTDEVLQDARRLLVEALAVPEPGPRLTDQTERLDRLITLASTPIPVTLISDNATEVTVYRVGDLGAFASKEIELKPGNYTAVGQRRGYRDVRESFTVLPGADNGPVTVICVDPI